MSVGNKADQSLRFALLRHARAVDISAADDTLSTPSVLYIGTGGDVKVDTLSGTTVTYKNFADGQFLPVLVTKVYKTGTSASNMLAHKE